MTPTLFCPSSVRPFFPFFEKRGHLAYLDNAATSQRLGRTIDRMVRFYQEENSNVHRGAYALSEEATAAYEMARMSIAGYFGAESVSEIIFTGGTTDGINAVAHGLEEKIDRGDEILITALEHHSNILPWLRLANRRGAILRIVDILPSGQLNWEDFQKKLSERTRIAAFTHVSNVFGTINPVHKMVKLAKKMGAYTLIDGAQRAASGPIDVRGLDCDFYAISGHKMFGPMGIGILYGKRNLLASMDPIRLGGGMVDRLTPTDVSYRELPDLFEAGTPNVASAIALRCAFDFLKTVSWDAYYAYEALIRAFIEERAERIPFLRLLGRAEDKTGIYSFFHRDIHSHDLASILAGRGVCARAGNHCAQLVMHYAQIPHSLRASFSIYNSMEDAERLMDGIEGAIKILGE
ncbi:MAG: cysteine desulfurase [Puniceicoccales bacterium]|jgi:cysteine desulfurase/selenocysteine lyase|nr:cysteine desulfurase [Puniceicoccales bacterium]